MKTESIFCGCSMLYMGTMSQSMVMSCLTCDCSMSVIWNASVVIQLNGREGQSQLMLFCSLVCSELKEPEAGKPLIETPVRDMISVYCLISVRI